jgi:Ring finger domain
MTRTLPLASCGLCAADWTPDAALVESRNPSCPHYFHKECILHHLLHQSSDCPECHKLFLSLDGDYFGGGVENDNIA